jgi:SAM-dependent methyltransferase
VKREAAVIKHHADSRAFWDSAATKDPVWYVATGSHGGDQEFFAQGAAETDHFLCLCAMPPLGADSTMLEIGCGVGRMTARLAELAGRVLATDVSPEMLARCRRTLGDRSNVEYLLLPGNGELVGIPDRSVDAVFSYITLQHVPTGEAQLRYLAESVRVLRVGGRAAIQIRAPGWRARAYDWVGHLGHFLAGRRTLRPEWRGNRLRRLAITQAVESAGGQLTALLPHGPRHVWVVIERR